jgi:hypothetical protein
MKIIIAAFLIVCSCGLHSQKKFKLEVDFKYTPPDCNAKSVQAARPEAPLTNTKFYVYLADKCVDSIQTDNNGAAILKLAPGIYSLFESWKHFKRTPDNSPLSDFYSDCLAQEWAKPNYKLNIAEGNFNMTYYNVSAARCPNQYACLKVRHLPGEIKRGG